MRFPKHKSDSIVILLNLGEENQTGYVAQVLFRA